MFYILFIYCFCFYFTFTAYRNILNTIFLMVRKGKKKQFKSQLPSWLLKVSLFSNPPYYSNLPPPPPFDYQFMIFFPTSPTILHPPSIRDLRVYTFFAICNITYESNKPHKTISVLSLDLILFFLLCVSSDMETNSFT